MMTAFRSRKSIGSASGRCATRTSSSTVTLVVSASSCSAIPTNTGSTRPRPLLVPQRDPDALLPRAEDAPEQADLGRNGCYLVMRQLRQDVRVSGSELDRQAEGDADLRDRLAAAMVGREKEWRTSGSARRGQLNAFTYQADPQGLRCPLGAHIRRTNPRNADLPPGPPGILSSSMADFGIQRRGTGAGSGRIHALSSPASPRTKIWCGAGAVGDGSLAPAQIPGSISSALWPTSRASSSSCKARG